MDAPPAEAYEDTTSSFAVNGKTYQITHPIYETLAIKESFSGQEYPLPPKLVDACRNLPCIDIGSHVGASAMWFYANLKPSRILCFEPNPDASPYLKQNCPWAESYRVGVSDQGGKAQFFYRRPWFTGGMFCIGQENDVREIDLVAGIDVIDLVQGDIGVMKIDAECAEVKILFSMLPELHRVKFIYLECHTDTHRRLVDQLLHDFTLYHAHSCNTWWGQTTLGYINKQYAEELRTDGKEGV